MEALTKIYETLKNADKLPSPKGVALEILRNLEDDDLSIHDLAKMVEKDPAISARLIRTANAPVTGVSRQISTVRDACSLLGAQSVQAIALAFSMLQNNQSGACIGFDYEEFWSRSLARAASMRRISAYADSLTPDESFTYGLLSLIGRLGLASVFPEKYEEVLELAKDGNWIDTAEIEIFGVGGEQLSAIMTQEWGMPRLCELMHWQFDQPDDDPSMEIREMESVLQFGRATAQMFITGETTTEFMQGVGESAAELGLTPESMFETFDCSIEDWRTGGRELGVKTRPVPKLSELYATLG